MAMHRSAENSSNLEPAPFAPTGLMANAHLQSVLTSSPWRKRRVQKRSRAYRENAERQLVTTPHGVNLLGYRSGASTPNGRSEEHTSELQSLRRISYAVLCLKKKNDSNVLRVSCSEIEAPIIVLRVSCRWGL